MGKLLQKTSAASRPGGGAAAGAAGAGLARRPALGRGSAGWKSACEARLIRTSPRPFPTVGVTAGAAGAVGATGSDSESFELLMFTVCRLFFFACKDSSFGANGAEASGEVAPTRTLAPVPLAPLPTEAREVAPSRTLAPGP